MLAATFSHLIIALALFVTPAITLFHGRDASGLSALSDNFAETWPAPNTTGGTSWSTAYARAKSLVDQMTLEEKVQLITGQSGRCVGQTAPVERLGVPALCLEDGPAGVRPILGVSQFPSGLATAATWDKDLIYQRGYAMGQEFHDQGVNIALSPVTGGPLGRSPLGGRNWEGFSPDPYVTGSASYLTVKGMQDAGILTTAKHWVGYEQDTYRDPYNLTESYSVFPALEQQPISSNIDNKATHELYMWGFAEAVRAGTGYVLCSYNEVNRTHSCANAYTNNNLLKGELNFQGALMSDWGGDWGDAAFINGGLDMSMPGSGFGGMFGNMFGDALLADVKNSSVTESRVNDAVLRTLVPWIAFGQADTPLPNVTFNAVPTFFVTDDAHWRDVRKESTMDLIRKIGEDSATLLKNVNKALPLQKPKVVSIVGSDAGPNMLSAINGGGTNSYPAWNPNGTLSLGGGSGWAIPPYLVTPYESINYRARKMNSQVYTIFNDTAYDAIGSTVQVADVALVFVSAYATEGKDRPNLYLDNNGEKLIKTVARNNSNTIVVIHAGGPVLVEDWIDLENVTAVIQAHYPGQEAGDAIASVLFGDVSPSGKMPYTTGHSLEEYPPHTIVSDRVVDPQSYFNESTLIDYRWFSAKNIVPRFEFGFGLSYSTFDYSNINVRDAHLPDNTSVQATNEPFIGSNDSNSLYDTVVEVTAEITNTGNATACEVAQLYVTLPGSSGIWLRGFDKLKALAPGETRTATFALRRKDLSLWSTVRQSWYIPSEDIKLQVGSSSTKLTLNATWSSR
ncbi:glycoside hydrolase [Punctularia strigosozonata HHB-11173 SS5]|uniref:glycoside hydrolase n=1 Tax=Punctularia strigosozonata (strain HHB-11173) TaxID=741275 RepID=UPI0004418665|nr:glycoside hydrolase [Punctularia strigosozonata HHB-11173 SS5]EIN14278.1 glycoside hydrolase [Punctularia strigosozonata HHB-11173 SS5]